MQAQLRNASCSVLCVVCVHVIVGISLVYDLASGTETDMRALNQVLKQKYESEGKGLEPEF